MSPQLSFLSAIPVFSGLLGIIGALFGALLCIILQACMWFYDNFGEWRINQTLRYRLLFAWNTWMLIAGVFVMVVGTWASVLDIKHSYDNDGGTAAFTCADNSNST